MKVFIAVLALCMGVAVGLASAAVDTHEQNQSLKKRWQEEEALRDACLVETGADMDVLRKAVDTNKWDAVDEKGKCFMACALKKKNMADEQGNLHLGNIRKELIRDRRPEQVQKIIDRCGAKKRSGRCETEFFFMKCLLGDFKGPVIMSK